MRATSGNRSRPIASSLGRMRVLMAAMRGWKPSMSKTLKSAGLKPGNAMLGASSGVGRVRIEWEDRPPDPLEVEAGEVGRGQPRGVHLDDLAGNGVEGGAVVDRRLDDEDLLGDGVEAAGPDS